MHFTDRRPLRKLLQIWKSEGAEYITEKVPADTKTIFIDGQIILMQSRVDGCRTWREFALNVFGRRLQSAHAAFDHVILAFDNYKATPVFKSIEQAKRVKTSAGFAFTAGQKLQDTPPPPAVWPSALQNRTFKSHLICVVVGLLLDHYKPPRRGTSLTVDFVNSVHVSYPLNADDTHETLDDNTELGESDIKFMRYADKCDRLVVDSIDSDVVLIALLYAESGGRADVFVRRIATRAIDEVCSCTPKKSGFEVIICNSYPLQPMQENMILQILSFNVEFAFERNKLYTWVPSFLHRLSFYRCKKSQNRPLTHVYSSEWVAPAEKFRRRARGEARENVWKEIRARARSFAPGDFAGRRAPSSRP